jgi:hypothetical protein
VEEAGRRLADVVLQNLWLPGARFKRRKICGSPVPGLNDESRMFVPAGLITDGGDSLKVKHHIWVDSKAVWDVIGDSGRQHREAFER